VAELPAGPAARLTAPVSRMLAVTDLERSIAFFREVLGFTVRPGGELGTVTLVRGPAEVQMAATDAAWDSTFERRPRGSAVLHFESDDLDALREEFATRGGEPSVIERANWIKMRLFEVRDPDGHVLWFGQTFAEPVLPRPEPVFRKIMPLFPLDDVPAGVVHYRDVLGFSVNYEQADFAVMDRDEARILLDVRTERHRGIGACTVYVRDADALYAELVGRGARVTGEPVNRPWGLREFTVLDPGGNEITLAQTFE
jgi:uncharacterized glyoxalase superfamily protein PhnB